jgi:hypothetical protein
MGLCIKLPAWIQAWYWLNVFLILPGDWLFVQLRPHSLLGGSFSHFFVIFNIYAEFDTLFADLDDIFLRFMYSFFQPVDFAIMSYLFYKMRRLLILPLHVANVCLCHSVFCFTKTTLYCVYSWPFLAKFAIPITLLNGTWALSSLVIAFTALRGITAANADADTRIFKVQ